MIFDHIVKVGRKYYEPGEDVPVGVDEKSAPAEISKEEPKDVVETPVETPKRGRRKRG